MLISSPRSIVFGNLGSCVRPHFPLCKRGGIGERSTSRALQFVLVVPRTGISSPRALSCSFASHLKGRIDAGSVSLMGVYENVLQKVKDLDVFLRKVLASALVSNGERRVRCFPNSFCDWKRNPGSEDWISAIRKSDGSLATDISSFCSSWVHLYSSLFSAESLVVPIQDQLLSNLTTRLSPEDSAKGDGLLSLDEVFRTLEGMSDDNSPGSDGLPKEFYLACWHIAGLDLVGVLNDSFASGLLPLSQRGALISLIFKKGDRLDHKN